MNFSNRTMDRCNQFAMPNEVMPAVDSEQSPRATLLFLVAILALQGLFSVDSRAQTDPKECLGTRALGEEQRTEVLPTGACPIKAGQMCYDKSYGLEVWNQCTGSIRIHIEAGTRGKYGSSTGEYVLSGGDSKKVYRCLEANGGCTGVVATVLGYTGAQQNASPIARMTDGNGTSSVALIRDGTVRPNQYGGTDTCIATIVWRKSGDLHRATLTKLFTRQQKLCKLL